MDIVDIGKKGGSMVILDMDSQGRDPADIGVNSGDFGVLTSVR